MQRTTPFNGKVICEVSQNRQNLLFYSPITLFKEENIAFKRQSKLLIIKHLRMLFFVDTIL
jgi:hypothetical protein